MAKPLFSDVEAFPSTDQNQSGPGALDGNADGSDQADGSRCHALVATSIAGTPSADRELDPLAAEINRHHANFTRSVQTCLDDAKLAGEKLLLAKEQIGHGKWIEWQETHCDFSLRTAQKYMRVASRWQELGGNAPPTAHLTVTSMLDTLAHPEIPRSPDADSPHENESAGLGSGAKSRENGDQAQASDHQDAGADVGDGDREAPGQPRVRVVPHEADRHVAGGEPTAPPSFADELAKYEERCRRLQAIYATRLSKDHRAVRAKVGAGIDALLVGVVGILLRHGKRACTPGVTRTGADPTLLAMVLAKELRKRLDPIKLFKPRKPKRTAEQDVIPIRGAAANRSGERFLGSVASEETDPATA